MYSPKTLHVTSRVFIFLSTLIFLVVSLTAFADPQVIIESINVSRNTDNAFSSIRAVFGVVGLATVISLIYFSQTDRELALALLCLLWGLYSASRVTTFITAGLLQEFEVRWLCIETLCFTTALLLFYLNRRRTNGV